MNLLFPFPTDIAKKSPSSPSFAPKVEHTIRYSKKRAGIIVGEDEITCPNCDSLYIESLGCDECGFGKVEILELERERSSQSYWEELASKKENGKKAKKVKNTTVFDFSEGGIVSEHIIKSPNGNIATIFLNYKGNKYSLQISYFLSGDYIDKLRLDSIGVSSGKTYRKTFIERSTFDNLRAFTLSLLKSYHFKN